MTEKIRICHIITGLGQGGAENMLYNLLKYTNRNQFIPSVVSLLPDGTLSDPIRALDIRVETLNMGRGIPSPFKIAELKKILKINHIDVVQCWMYHANLLGGIAARLLSIPPIWNIHHSNLENAVNKKNTLRIVHLCAKLSPYIPQKIIYCAQQARVVHEKIGYAADKSIVIPNGFEISRFCASSEAKASLREELGLSPESLLIGLAARFDPQKDHASFFQAANLLLEKNEKAKDIHFILCGTGVSNDNPAILELIPESLHSNQRLHLLGARSDMPHIYAALDIATLSSLGEAFPNVVGEAMACEVPCVVTDVGDAAWIVGDTGIVVPPSNPTALANGWGQLIEKNREERRLLGTRARKRIEDTFDIAQITDQYAAVHEDLSRRT